MPTIPSIAKLANGASQLLVNGKPILLRSGELQNSSLSSASYMSGVWSNLRTIGLNCVLGSVTWEQIEPIEGEFSWNELDKILRGAEEHGLKLVLLWFGAFKNGKSCVEPVIKARLTYRHVDLCACLDQGRPCQIPQGNNLHWRR